MDPRDNCVMPFPTVFGRINKVATNRLMIRLANRPPFAALRHVGRSTGREYRIPINVFPAGDDFVLALTYGPDADWVKNVVDAGGATLEYRGAAVTLVDPRMIGWADAKPYLPRPVRLFLTVLRVDRFLLLHPG